MLIDYSYSRKLSGHKTPFNLALNSVVYPSISHHQYHIPNKIMGVYLPNITSPNFSYPNTPSDNPVIRSRNTQKAQPHLSDALGILTI